MIIPCATHCGITKIFWSRLYQHALFHMPITPRDKEILERGTISNFKSELFFIAPQKGKKKR